MGILDPQSPLTWLGSVWERVAHRAPAPTSLYQVEMAEQADLSAVRVMPRGAERRAAAWDAMQAVARRSQSPLEGQFEAWKQQGIIDTWQGHALVNQLEFAVPNAQREAFERLVAAEPTFGRMTKFDMSPMATPKPDPAPGSEVPALREEPELVTPSRNVVVPGSADMVDGIAWGVKQIRADEAWKQNIDGTGVTVGVLDTGIDASHPNFRRSLDSDRTKSIAPGSRDGKDPHMHGTHTSGTVAGGGEPGFAVGVAPGATLRVAPLGNSFVDSMEWLFAPGDEDPVHGARDARRGVDIMSNSWGLDASARRLIPFADRAVEHLDAAGIVQVYSAGNEGPGDATLAFPAERTDVIAVAANDRKGRVTSFSSRGPALAGARLGPDISAPGEAVPSSIPVDVVDTSMALSRVLGKMMMHDTMHPVPHTKGRYWTMDGTSMSGPHVAGVAALLLQKYPQLSPAQVKDAIMGSATDIHTPGWDAASGAGLVDVPGSLDLAGNLVGATTPATTDAD